MSNARAAVYVVGTQQVLDRLPPHRKIDTPLPLHLAPQHQSLPSDKHLSEPPATFPILRNPLKSYNPSTMPSSLSAKDCFYLYTKQCGGIEPHLSEEWIQEQDGPFDWIQTAEAVNRAIDSGTHAHLVGDKLGMFIGLLRIAKTGPHPRLFANLLV